MSLEPLDDELRDLFDRERQTHADDPAAAQAALRRFEVTVAFAAVSGVAAAGVIAAASGAGAGAAATAARAVAVKKVILISALAFVAGVGAGELHQVALHANDGPPIAARATNSPATAAPAVTNAPPAPMESALAVSPSALPDAPSASSATLHPSAAPPPAPPNAPSDLAGEQALIDTARAALARGRGDGALAATNEHATKYPRGRLAEERELLAVQALVVSGRTAEAASRAERFRRTFPASLFLPALDSALAGAKKDSGP